MSASTTAAALVLCASKDTGDVDMLFGPQSPLNREAM